MDSKSRLQKMSAQNYWNESAVSDCLRYYKKSHQLLKWPCWDTNCAAIGEKRAIVVIYVTHGT